MAATVRLFSKDNGFWGPALSSLLEIELEVNKHRYAGNDDNAVKAAEEALENFQEKQDALGQAGALYILAEHHLLQHRPLPATISASKGLSIFRELKSQKGELFSLMQYVHIGVQQTKNDESLQQIMQILVAAQELPDKEVEANALAMASLVRLARCEGDMALHCASNCLTLFRELCIEAGEAVALEATAKAHIMSGSGFEEASKAASACVNICQKFGDTPGEGHVQLLLAKTYIVIQGNDNKAIEAANKASALFVKSQDKVNQAMSLRVLATAHLALGDLGALKKTLETQLTILHELGMRKEEAATLKSLSQACAAQDLKEEAWKYASEALVIARSLKDNENERDLLHLLISIHANNQDSDGVLKAVDLFRESGDMKGTAAGLHMVAEIHLAKSFPDQALPVLDEALSLFRLEGDQSGEAEVLDKLALAHVARKAFDVALKFARDAFAVYQRIDSAAGQAGALHVMSTAHLAMHMPDAALKEASHARDIFRHIQEKSAESSAQRTVCLAHIANNDYEAAVCQAHNLKALFSEMGQKAGEAQALHMCASVHLSYGSADAALLTLKEALLTCRECGDRQLEADILLSVVNCFLTVDRGVEALRAASHALIIARESDDVRQQAAAMQASAQAQLVKGEAQAALDSSMQAVELFRQISDMKGEASALSIVAEARLSKKDTEEAFQVARDAMTISQKEGDLRGEATACLSAAEACFAQSKTEDGLEHARRALHLFHDVGDKRGECMSKEIIATRRAQSESHKLTGITALHNTLGSNVNAVAGINAPLSVTQESFTSAQSVFGLQQQNDLTGLVTVVTGASRGIGKGIASELARAGAIVFVTARSSLGSTTEPMLQGSIDETAGGLNRLGGVGVAVHMDHADGMQNRAFSNLMASLGRVDVLVNNSWYMPKPDAIFFETKCWWLQPNRFLNEQVACGGLNHISSTVLLVPYLRRGKGLVLNVSHCASHSSTTQMPLSFQTSKAALEQTMNALSDELRKYRVFSLTLWPGDVKTERMMLYSRMLGKPVNDKQTTRFSGRAVVSVARLSPEVLARYTACFRTVSASDIQPYEIDGTRHSPDLHTFHTSGRTPAPKPHHMW